MSAQVIWSFDSQKDLKKIYLFCAKQDINYANRVVQEIIRSPRTLLYAKQYQEDEYLGSSYRRFFIKHWRAIYKVENNVVFIIRIFDTRQNPEKIK